MATTTVKPKIDLSNSETYKVISQGWRDSNWSMQANGILRAFDSSAFQNVSLITARSGLQYVQAQIKNEVNISDWQGCIESRLRFIEGYVHSAISFVYHAALTVVFGALSIALLRQCGCFNNMASNHLWQTGWAFAAATIAFIGVFTTKYAVAANVAVGIYGAKYLRDKTEKGLNVVFKEFYEANRDKLYDTLVSDLIKLIKDLDQKDVSEEEVRQTIKPMFDYWDEPKNWRHQMGTYSYETKRVTYEDAGERNGGSVIRSGVNQLPEELRNAMNEMIARIVASAVTNELVNTRNLPCLPTKVIEGLDEEIAQCEKQEGIAAVAIKWTEELLERIGLKDE